MSTFFSGLAAVLTYLPLASEVFLLCPAVVIFTPVPAYSLVFRGASALADIATLPGSSWFLWTVSKHCSLEDSPPTTAFSQLHRSQFLAGPRFRVKTTLRHNICSQGRTTGRDNTSLGGALPESHPSFLSSASLRHSLSACPLQSTMPTVDSPNPAVHHARCRQS